MLMPRGISKSVSDENAFIGENAFMFIALLKTFYYQMKAFSSKMKDADSISKAVSDENAFMFI